VINQRGVSDITKRVVPVTSPPTPHRTKTEKSEADQAEGGGFGDSCTRNSKPYSPPPPHRTKTEKSEAGQAEGGGFGKGCVLNILKLTQATNSPMASGQGELERRPEPKPR
jgi:hypothetical protein